MSEYRNPMIRDSFEGLTASDLLAAAEVRPTIEGEFRIRVDHPDEQFQNADLYLNTYGAAQMGELSLVLRSTAPGAPSVSLRVVPSDVERWRQLRRERALAYAADAGLSL